MAETASSVITDALTDIFVVGAKEPIESVDMQLGIRYLNRMMSELDANGIALGFTVIVNPSDTVTVPDGALGGVVSNLATKLAKPFGAAVTQELAIAASDGYKAMLKLGVTIEPSSYPCTLSVGSGNDQDTTNDKFYPCPADSTLTESNGNILLESAT